MDKFCQEFIKPAQMGHEDCLSELSVVARGRLRTYIYRVTLNHDLTEDLLQESLLEMVKSLKQLRDVERFWPWLYRIAQSKIQQHFSKKKKRPELQLSVFGDEFFPQKTSDQHGDGLQSLMQKETSQKVLSAIGDLKQQHRAVLSLRCIEQMPYSEIAMALDCKELNVRILFFRAKQALKKQLTRKGLSKESLLMSLALFARFTEPAEEAGLETASTATTGVADDTALYTTVTAGGEAGMIAAIIGAAATKAGIAVISLTLGLGTIGGLSVLSGDRLPKRGKVRSIHYTVQSKSSDPSVHKSLSKGAYEQWYYFPKGVDGHVYKRMQRWDTKQQNKLCAWLENDQGNYYYHSGRKTAYISNYNLYRSNLNVRRLPTDTAEFTAFLDRVEGDPAGIVCLRDKRTGLLRERTDDRFVDARHFCTEYEYNNLNADDFSYKGWAGNAKLVDQRDEMHRRGWCWFRVQGELAGQTVEGQGRIPFVYSSYKSKPPWLKLEIGNNQSVIDSRAGTCLTRQDGKVATWYPAGSFFRGLPRPWTGYHTIDTVRRDAAEMKIWFHTTNMYDKAFVILTGKDKDNNEQVKIKYHINLEKDLVEKIEFISPEKGELVFTYLDGRERAMDEFIEPQPPKTQPKVEQKEPGILWLIQLIKQKNKLNIR